MKIVFKIPYDPNLSKNKKYIELKEWRGRRKKILNPKYKAIQDQIYYMILKETPIFKKAKIKVDILWMRNSMRGDVHNFVECINDAIKIYTKRFKIDDNWFSGSYDFIYQKKSKENNIYITITQ